jgi:hypothetical protein
VLWQWLTEECLLFVLPTLVENRQGSALLLTKVESTKKTLCETSSAYFSFFFGWPLPKL